MVIKELCNLQEQIRDLRFMIQNKLDAMERSVTGAQRYINNLIPWTTEVHQTLTDFMSGALTGQEKGGDRKKFASSSSRGHYEHMNRDCSC